MATGQTLTNHVRTRPEREPTSREGRWPGHAGLSNTLLDGHYQPPGPTGLKTET